MDELSGKVAVITGAGSGIGRGMALAFAAAGMRVVVADIEPDAAAAVAAEVDGLAVTTDVADLASVRALADMAFDEMGGVHLLCNNAGVAPIAPVDQLTEDDWQWGLSVNLFGVVNGLLAFLPRMRDQAGRSHVVNTSSLAGHIPVHAVYSAAKYGVVAISDVLRQEAAAYGVGVSVLCPGFLRSRPDELGSERLDGTDLGDGSTGADPSGHPPADVLDPDDVGRAVLRGIERDQPYIFTHRELRGPIRRRFDRIIAEIP